MNLRTLLREALTAARTAFDELTEAYEAIRRMVERGYVSLKG